MAKDYKHRVQSASYLKYRRRRNRSSVMFWRLLLVLGLIGAFGFFLNLIRTKVPELLAGKSQIGQTEPANQAKPELPVKQLPPAPVEATQKPETAPAEAVQKAEAEPKPEVPPPPPAPEPTRFDFYTLLPEAETVVPDYEIKTRVREELVGKTKTTKYVMQAGSFREADEADRHKAKLAQLGIEARVEKAKVGTVIWHRVKIGPYDNPTSVSTLKDLLQKNGIGVVVTEVGQ